MKGPELSLAAIAVALLQSQPASAVPTLYIYFQDDVLKVYATNNDAVAYTCDVSVRYSFNNLMNGRWSGTAVFGFSVPPGVVDAQEESFGVVLDPQIVSEVSSCA